MNETWSHCYIICQINWLIQRQIITHCLHCSSWLNTASFPDATASCNGVLKRAKDTSEAPSCVAPTLNMWRIQRDSNAGSCDLPASAVLHVRVGSSSEQSLCDPCHAAHHLCRVFLGAEWTDQVKWGFHGPHCGRIHLSWVANQEDGGKFITWKKE